MPSYPLDLKHEVVEFYKNNTLSATTQKYNVSVGTVCNWYNKVTGQRKKPSYKNHSLDLIHCACQYYRLSKSVKPHYTNGVMTMGIHARFRTVTCQRTRHPMMCHSYTLRQCGKLIRKLKTIVKRCVSLKVLLITYVLMHPPFRIKCLTFLNPSKRMNKKHYPSCNTV